MLICRFYPVLTQIACEVSFVPTLRQEAEGGFGAVERQTQMPYLVVRSYEPPPETPDKYWPATTLQTALARAWDEKGEGHFWEWLA